MNPNGANHPEDLQVRGEGIWHSSCEAEDVTHELYYCHPLGGASLGLGSGVAVGTRGICWRYEGRSWG